MLKHDLATALQAHKREILVDLLRQNLTLTLADIHQLARGELGALLGSITLNELRNPRHAQAIATPDHPIRKSARNKAPSPSVPHAAVPVNTRSREGREAFDKLVLEALKSIGTATDAKQVQLRVGGDGAQVRTALNRLIEVGSVTWTGRARGTRYLLA